MTPNNFRVKNGLTVSNGASITGNVVITSGELVVGGTAINSTTVSAAAGNAYSNAIAIAANATNLTSGTVAFARLPSQFIGTTTIQSTSAAQAVSGITTLAAGNTSITGFVNVSAGANVAGDLIVTSETIGVRTRFLSGKASPAHTAGSLYIQYNSNDPVFIGGGTGTSNLTITGSANVSTSVNSALLTVGTSFIANTVGAFHTGTVNAASFTTTNFRANTTGVFPTSNTVGNALGNTTARWALSATTGSFNDAVSGITTLAAGNTTITGFANVTSTIQGGSSLTIAGAASGITTLAAGNTTITGFANVTTTLQVGGNTTITGNTTSMLIVGTAADGVDANSTVISVGNTTVFTTVNSTAFSGTADNATNFGGSSLATVQGQITGNAATAYTNAVSYTDTKIGTANSAITGNAATAYTNAIAIAANATNLTSGTVAFARLPSLFVGTTTIQSTSAAQALSGITTLAAGNTTITGDITVSGNLTISGTTTNINSTNLLVEDKNIILGDVATPSDVTADGGGITLKGATDKTFNWVDATDSWTASEHIDIAAGKVYKIGTTTIANSTALGTGILASSLTSVGTLSSLTLGGAVSGVTTLAAGNTSITGFANVSTSVNAASHTVGTSFIANATLLFSAANLQISTINATSWGATLTSNATTALLTIGNSSVSSTINGSNFSGTANNASFLGGTAAASYQLNSTLSANVATLTANNSTNLGGSSLATVQGQITGNAATAYTNAIAIAANATNLTSGTVAFARLPSLFLGTTTIQSTSAPQAVSGITTLAAGNTSITGFANVSTTLQVGTNTATFGTAAFIVANGNFGVGTSSPPQAVAVGNATDQVGLGITGANSIVYFGSPSTGSGGIKRIQYDRSTGGLLFIGGNTTSSATQLTLGSAGEATFTNAVSGITTLAAGNTSITGFANVTSTLQVGGVATFAGNVNFSGTGHRILGDMTNATFTNRVAFQTTTVNGSTNIHAIPNGSGTQSGFKAESDATFANGQFFSMDIVGGSDARFNSSIRGTGSYVPMTFWTSGAERIRVDTSGNMGIGTTTPVRPLHAFYNSAVVGAYSAVLQGAVGGYGAGVSFQSVLTGGALAEMARITADGESSWDTTAANQDAGLRFYTALNGTVSETLRLNSAGNMGIGTTAPTQKLHVVGLINSSDGASDRSVIGWESAATYGGAGLKLINRDNSNLILGTNNTAVVTINTSGATAFTGAVSGITTLAAGNTSITGFANVSTSVNSALLTVGTSFIANTTGAYHTGTVNAAALTVGTSFVANTTQVTIAAGIELSANGGVGTAGQVLTSNGTSGSPYWSSAGASYTFSTGLVNTSGTITVNSAYIATISANNASFLGGTAAASYQLNSTLSANVATLAANNASFLGGTAAASYQLNSTLSANVATLTANNSTNLAGRTWQTAGTIGSTTANTGAFTTLTTTSGGVANTVTATAGQVISYAGMNGGRTYYAYDLNTQPSLYEARFVNMASSTNKPSGMTTDGYWFGMGAGDTTTRGFSLMGTTSEGLWYRSHNGGSWTRTVDTSNIGSLTANNASFLGGTAAASYQLNSTLSANVATLNAATATALQTARTIGGVSFNGTANINLPGVNTAGNQNTSGTAASTPNPTFSADAVSKDNITTRTDTGFYESSSGTLAEGWPTDSGGWHHLISATHSNDGNYYALQIASRFDTQNLYFRNTNGSGSTAWNTILHGSVDFNNLTNKASGSGTYTTSGDFRAPIFYDSNNTAYYIDAASTSVLSSLALGGASSVPQGALWISGEIWVSGNNNRVAFSTDGSTDSTPNASIRGSGTGAGDLVVQNWSGSASQDNFYVFGASRDAAAAGNITAYYSDERLKTKTGMIDNALDKVMSLEGFTYIENELARSVGYNNQKQQVGLSAQKVKAVLPEAVALAPFDYDLQDDGTIVSKSGEDYLTVDYSRLVPLLIEAIKEQQTHINRLEEKINSIQNNRG